MTRASVILALLLSATRAGVAEDGPSVEDGASRHWAFEPVRRSVPPVDPTEWSSNPIDQFIAAQLRSRGLAPVRPADRRTWIRRAYFDLIGLPPRPAEIRTFLDDRSPSARARVIGHLLASPQYGERWGRHWMDVVRYADTAGDNADYPIPEARRYRDYIIDAFNTDKPYDQFVREQLAGDILAGQGPRERYAERVIATGFIALSRRYATAPYELWHLTLEDTIETVGRTFLGLTMRCARCHDHKYDPVTMEDYYGFYGVFASTKYPYAGSEEFTSKGFGRRDFVPLIPPDEAAPIVARHQRTIARHVSEVGRLEEALQQLDAADATGRKTLEKRLKAAKERLRNLRRSGLPPGLPAAYAVSEGSAVDARIQPRGDPAAPGPSVPRSTPRFLNNGRPHVLTGPGSGRLELAQRLTDRAHPLTARVMVNRIWQHHFGQGLVATPSNFGRRGAPPTHPQLLDYLAARFVDSGWSIKAMHRLIMLSRTYGLASVADDRNLAKDPQNRWYWRHDRRRLEAEAIRDAMLAVSGRLDPARPERHPFPPIDQWKWTQHQPFKAHYASVHRSVYLMTQRIQRRPFLVLFDGPDTNTTTAVRTRSTVPLQALFMMNDEFVGQQAQGLADRLIGATSVASRRISLAHELTWGRLPSAREQEKCSAYIQQFRSALAAAGVDSGRIEREAWTSLMRVMLSASEFVYMD